MYKLYMTLVVTGLPGGGVSVQEPVLVGEFANEMLCRQAMQDSQEGANFPASGQMRLMPLFACVRAR
jgi:hypothetical protein